MKIGIVSDTHGCATVWDRLINSYFNDVDYIIHAGDVLYHGPRNPIMPDYNPKELAKLINESSIPIYFARGNCDAEVDQMVLKYPIQSPYLSIREKGLSIMVSHGDKLTQEEILEYTKLYHINLFVTGHTHIPILEKKNNVILLNPGSPSLPKGEEIPTIALLEDNTISIIDISSKKQLNSIKIL